MQSIPWGVVSMLVLFAILAVPFLPSKNASSFPPKGLKTRTRGVGPR